MAHRILDRVQETTLGTGTGALTLAGATTRMLGLSAAGFANGDTFWGLIEHATAAEWEIALCTFSAGAITRATPLKSSTGATVSFALRPLTSVQSGALKVPVGNYTLTSSNLSVTGISNLSTALSVNLSLIHI